MKYGTHRSTDKSVKYDQVPDENPSKYDQEVPTEDSVQYDQVHRNNSMRYDKVHDDELTRNGDIPVARPLLTPTQVISLQHFL